MIVADNLAAHAFGGLFVIFPQYKEIPMSHFTLRTKNAYDNNIIAINEDPNLSHLYGIKENF